MNKKILLISFLTLSFLIFSFTNQSVTSPKDIVNQFIQIIENTKTLQLTTQINEKIDSKFLVRKANFKIQASPFQLYMKEEYPVKGREVLYVTGKNEGKALINPGSFPWTNLNLNPIGNTMRTDNHHSIFKSGYFFINKVLKNMSVKYASNIDKMLKYEGMVNYSDVYCYKLTFQNPNFGYTTYTIKANETLEDISNRLFIDDYMIMDRNPEIDNVEDISPGQKIKIPTDYGKSFTLYFSKETNLLIGIKVFDENGLWEEYTYSNIELNPVFTAFDFSADNPLYGF